MKFLNTRQGNKAGFAKDLFSRENIPISLDFPILIFKIFL